MAYAFFTVGSVAVTAGLTVTVTKDLAESTSPSFTCRASVKVCVSDTSGAVKLADAVSWPVIVIPSGPLHR